MDHLRFTLSTRPNLELTLTMNDQHLDPSYIALGQKMGLLPSYMDPTELSRDDKQILREILSSWDVLNELGLVWESLDSDEDNDGDNDEDTDTEVDEPDSPFGCLYESSDDEEE